MPLPTRIKERAKGGSAGLAIVCILGIDFDQLLFPLGHFWPMSFESFEHSIPTLVTGKAYDRR